MLVIIIALWIAAAARGLSAIVHLIALKILHALVRVGWTVVFVIAAVKLAEAYL